MWGDKSNLIVSLTIRNLITRFTCRFCFHQSPLTSCVIFRILDMVKVDSAVSDKLKRHQLGNSDYKGNTGTWEKKV